MARIAGQHARQQAGDMRRLAVAGESRAGIVMIDQREGEGEIVPGNLLEGAQLAREGESLPAVLLGKLDRVKPGLAGSLGGLQRITALPFPARGVGSNVFYGKRLGARDDGAFLGGENFIEHGLLSHASYKC